MKFVEPIRDFEKIEEIKTLMRKDKNYRDLTLFTIGYRIGLRISDLLALRWTDFLDRYELDKYGNLDKSSVLKPVGSTIEIVEKKTGKIREFPLVKAVHDSLAELKGNTTSRDYIFESRTRHFDGHRQPISRAQAWRILNKYAKMAGIDYRVGTHTLRKTFGYYNYSTGRATVAELQDILNHSSEAITLRYIGINQDTRNRIYQGMQI